LIRVAIGRADAAAGPMIGGDRLQYFGVQRFAAAGAVGKTGRIRRRIGERAAEFAGVQNRTGIIVNCVRISY